MLKKRSSVRKLARRIEQGFTQLYPAMPEVPKRNLPLIVAAQIEVSTVNTAILTSYLPLEMTRSDLRDQGLRRQLSSKSLDSVRMAKPFATQLLCESAEFGQSRIQLRSATVNEVLVLEKNSWGVRKPKVFLGR
uniref:Uncharacterized protein n=1 Tax=Candidatus Kentrum eta TaxID=2126337 RepID=A0A450VDG6_9GAMM|nr:MAG: hypothetical protein BECKH772A_GA0070896_102912 [Candidatus Kentron sp. H]